MKFPHLDGATTFPGADAHVYEQYVNTYDYHMWTPNTKIKLCRVKWREDGRDAVKFRDDAARDAWFDALDGEAVTLDTSMYIARADTDGVKIPVPYMTAQRYNYIVVDFSADIMQSPMQQADCQTRYHYFVTRVTAEAPNTTTLVLRRDAWMDYINTTTINGLLLARGHAPLTETTPADLLANPRENSVDMLAPDVDFSGSTSNRITDVKAFSLTGGVKYICFACTFDASQLAAMAATHGADVTATAPTYSGDDGTVTAWTWGAGGVDVGECRTLGTSYAHPRGRVPNNHTVFALRASTVTGGYIDNLFSHYPHIANGITACFVLSGDMFEFVSTQSTSVAGVNWTPITDTERTLSNISLSPDDFDMPEAVRDVTKLYVSPYSILEVTDIWGKSVTINIEDCGKLSVKSLVSTAYPLMRQVAYIDGVGASGITGMDVLNLADRAITGNIPNGDALRTLVSYDIPTYALQRRSIDAYRAANWNRTIVQGRESAITAYDNTAQTANVGLANARRSNATTVANTQRSNTAATNNTTANNGLRDALNKETQDANSQFNIYATTRMDDDLNTNLVKLNADVDMDVTLMNKTFIENSQTQAITNVVNGVTSAAGAMLSVAAAPVTGGASIIGAATTIGGAVGSNVCTNIAITNNSALNDTANYVATQKRDNARRANRESNTHAKTQMQSVLTRSITRDNNITKHVNDNATNTTANTVTASNANAAASAATGNDNAAASRNQTIVNAKRTMITTHDNATNTFADMQNQPAMPIGSYSGDAWSDEMAQRAIVVKIRTQTKSALLQAGSYMLRYGIASNKLYNKPNLTPCKHFAYWQAGDVWLTNNLAGNDALDAIRERLTDGVTIWNDPEEIGGNYLTNNL